jgi:hypothetical protein
MYSINSLTTIHSHRNYWTLRSHIEQSYPSVPVSSANDICAVCQEEFQSSAKQLPCKHQFHLHCLRGWLQRHHSCPLCRKSLIQQQQPQQPQPPPSSTGSNPSPSSSFVFPGRRHELFRFDGTRFSNWLPSIEIVSERATVASGTRLQHALTHLHEVFPHASRSVLLNALRDASGSVEGAVDLLLSQSTSDLPTTDLHSPPDQQDPPPSILPPPSTIPTTTTTTTTTMEPVSSPYSGGAIVVEGGTFATSSEERQKLLQERKRAMLEQARKLFEQQQSKVSASLPSVSLSESSTTVPVNTTTTTTTTTNSPTLERSISNENLALDQCVIATPEERRRVLLKAVEGRLINNNSTSFAIKQKMD